MTTKNIRKWTVFKIHNDILVCLLLVLATAAVYGQVRSHAFVNYDDTQYVSENLYVRSGLSLKSISWAFSFSFKDRTYWHPLTWLSHMLDCQLFGLRPGAHHLTNLFFHIANSLLLFLVFKRMTESFWRSAFIAALFALHPINVDSVAWVAERKNVLSTFFWILTMLTYAYYSKQPSIFKYFLVLLTFALGLLAKPMLVTLPFVLLLLDYWPLGRLRFGGPAGERSPIVSLVLEKVPLLVLALISIYLASLSLQKGEVIISTGTVPLDLRMANALVSYVRYLGKMIWPRDLAFFYPYPTSLLPLWQIIGAGLFLICISILTIRPLRSKPYLAIGWLWFMGTLVPVSGLMQGGLWPAMADRWAYVPFIGLFIVIAWGVPDVLDGWRYKKMGLPAMAAAFLLVLMATTWLQTRYWTNSLTLCEHALNVTVDNYVAHNNLGVSLEEQDRTEEALGHYSEALRIRPDSVVAHVGLGNLLRNQGEIAGAIGQYSEALRINPDSVRALNNLGVTLMEQGRSAEAIRRFSKSVRIKPDYVDGYNNLGLALAKLGRTSEAIANYSEALRISPDSVKTLNNLGLAFAKLGRTAEAIRHYSEVLRIDPNHAVAHNNLGLVLAEQGDTNDAIIHYNESLRINPGVAEVHTNLGAALLKQGKLDEAILHFREALRIKPSSAEAHDNLEKVLAARRKIKEDISKFQKALRTMPQNPAIHYQLGNLYKTDGQLTDAIDQYQKALSIQPGFVPALINLAGVYLTKEEYGKAISVWMNIIRLRPESPGTYYNIACIYAKQNRIEESIDWLKKAIEKGYENWDLIKTDKDLENIRGSSYYREITKGR
jgi:tetratricopeptide (TPR) repeat protein